MKKFLATILGFTFVLDSLLPNILVQAQQRPRILEHPADAVAAREEPLTLNCKATGRPAPEIFWYHNGTPLVPSERRVVLPEGSLFFLRVMHNKREQDAGIYWCEARSTAGIAVSRNATLQIAILRDDFRSVPKDTVALVGGPVVLNCTPPRGIPEPSVLWYKDDKLLDLSGKRLSMVESGSLMISEVQAQDAGRYECSAQNMAGSRSAPVINLKVLAPPTIVRGPQDTDVIEGEGLDIPCEIAGDPKPYVSWHREEGLLPEGRSRTLLDNTLRIEDARAEDQGHYTCKGYNEGGNVSVSIKLNVYATPTFIEAPADVDVKVGDTMSIPCRASGRPKATIIWDRISAAGINTPKLSEEFSRLLDEAATHEEIVAKAKIMSFRSKRNHNKNDLEQLLKSGHSSEARNTSMTISMRTKTTSLLNSSRHTRSVSADDGDDGGGGGGGGGGGAGSAAGAAGSDTNEGRDTGTALGAENDENFNEVTETTQAPGAGTGTNNNNSSTESPDLPTFEINKNGELLLKDVKKSDEGWYACAALNEAGSVVKKIYIRVLNPGDSSDIDPPDPPGSRWGSPQNIIIATVTAISSQSVDVTWEMTQTDAIPSTTMTLHYRPQQMATGGGTGGTASTTAVATSLSSSETKTNIRILFKDYAIATVMIDAKAYRLTDLRPHTVYEIFATVPNGFAGSVSNLRKGKTMDGPPSAPPTDVRVGVINNTAAYVRWSPPPVNLLNGELTGYKIQIKSNTTNRQLAQMSLNATTQSVVINRLHPGGSYIVRVAPSTAGGLGPYSPPAPLHMDPSLIARPPKTDPTLNAWSLSWMPGVALGILGILLISGAVFAVIWARRNKRNLKASYPGPVLTSSLPDKSHTLWLHGNTTIKPTHTFAPPPIPSEYAEVTQNMISKGLSQVAPPEPYATVTLQRGATTQSDDSCRKCSASPSSSEYNAPLRVPMNICEMLPPPPDHPYGSYKPPNNMTIRTNPAALSPQVMRRVTPAPPRWGTMPPPIPNFPQNWVQGRRMNHPPPPGMGNGLRHMGPGGLNHELYSENDYESGSVLYEQFCRENEASYFNEGGEPTEEYYRNVNMEFFEDQDFEPSTPPPPCPDSNGSRMNPNLCLLANSRHQQENSSSLNPRRIMMRNMQQQQQQHHQSRNSSRDATAANSSDDSESSDNRWAPRTRRSRSRSKSGDRKYRNDQ